MFLSGESGFDKFSHLGISPYWGLYLDMHVLIFETSIWHTGRINQVACFLSNLSRGLFNNWCWVALVDRILNSDDHNSLWTAGPSLNPRYGPLRRKLLPVKGHWHDIFIIRFRRRRILQHSSESLKFRVLLYPVYMLKNISPRGNQLWIWLSRQIRSWNGFKGPDRAGLPK
jgi:hypothetical protein